MLPILFSLFNGRNERVGRHLGLHGLIADFDKIPPVQGGEGELSGLLNLLQPTFDKLLFRWGHGDTFGQGGCHRAHLTADRFQGVAIPWKGRSSILGQSGASVYGRRTPSGHIWASVRPGAWNRTPGFCGRLNGRSAMHKKPDCTPVSKGVRTTMP